MPCGVAITPDGLGMTNVQIHNAELSESCALLGKLAGFLLRAQQRCRWHTCAVRAHQQDGHMLQINHLLLWAVQQQQACNCRCSGAEWLVSCFRASWSTRSCHIARLFVEARRKTSLLQSGSTLLAAVGRRACSSDRITNRILESVFYNGQIKKVESSFVSIYLW